MSNNTVKERLLNALTWLLHFCRFLWRRFIEQRGLQTASSLAYVTLLSLVPLFTVMFGFIGGLPVFEKLSSEIQSFMFSNFVPAFSDAIAQSLLAFSEKARQLTFTGTLVLVLIALMLIATIDDALNKVWHVKSRRNPLASFLVYWAVLTLGPLLVGVGLVSTSYLLSLPLLDDVYSAFSLKARLLRIMPFISTSIAFTLLYILVPNCYVNKRHALISGIIAAILFELAKFGFGIYVTAMPSYQAIYGAIAVIPIFLIWIYLSWVVLILGAHINYCLSNFDRQDLINGSVSDWDLTHVYRIIGELWLAQKRGDALSVQALKRKGVRLPQNRITEILDILQQGRCVRRTSGGQYMLSRDMDDVSVADLHRLLPCKLFNRDRLVDGDPWEASLTSLFDSYRSGMDEVLSTSLADLLKEVDVSKS